MSRSWQLSRRHMLKGIGASIALPFLEAMIPPGFGATSSLRPPVRSAFLFMPNGVHPDHWTPTGWGSSFELSPVLQPLSRVKGDITVFSELMNRSSLVEGADGHYAKTANLLTSLPIYKTTGADLHSGGISVDQLIAQHQGHRTLYGSLEYGMDQVTPGIDANVGFTRLYGSSISWKSPSQPCSKEINPRLAFDRLFRDYLPVDQRPPESPWKSSVLDLVSEDAQALQRKLGRADQNKLEEYLESIRSIEKRIDNVEKQKEYEEKLTPDMLKEIARLHWRVDAFAEEHIGVDITEKTRLMLDVIALAFWSDASRVATFMFGNSVSNRNFSFLDGVEGSHHEISHHKDDPKQLAQYEIINRWHIEQYAYLLEKLKSTPEGDGNLLDHSMIMFGSGLRDGNRHAPQNLPIVLAGKGGGLLKTGQNLHFREETPLSNLYLSMLRVLDIPIECFADSTGELCEMYG